MWFNYDWLQSQRTPKKKRYDDISGLIISVEGVPIRIKKIPATKASKKPIFKEGGWMAAKRKKDAGKAGIKGNRKEDLNPVRGTQRVIDPERGPENK